MVYWLLGLLVYLNQQYSFEKSLNNLDCVLFIGLLVYFSIYSLTGHQDSVRFIGLFGLLVYLVYWFIWFTGLLAP